MFGLFIEKKFWSIILSMKKFVLSLLILFAFIKPSYALDKSNFYFLNSQNREIRAVKKVLTSQVKYANKENFNKFISTFDEKYTNSDGFNLDTYSSLIKDIWESYEKITYKIEIKKVDIKDNTATVEAYENSYANLIAEKIYLGELRSDAKTIYHLKKNKNGKWKLVYDNIIEETSSILYGNARGLDIKLSVPNNIEANTDYTATLEFTPPKNTLAIASLACDKVEYPQAKTKEVFRTLPEDNILERIFTSNNDNANEYIVASIGLTKTTISDLNIRLNLTGFGYTVKRVNVIHEKKGQNSENDNN